MTRRHLSSLLDDPPLPGTGRLSILAAGFQLTGLVTAVASVGMGAAMFFPRLHWTVVAVSPALALASAVALSFTCFRTGRLLDQRRKAGVPLAALCFLSPLAAALRGTAPSLEALVFAGTGLLMLASVWRHLE